MSISYPSQEAVAAIRKKFPGGTRVELLEMDDVQAPPVGTKGTVRDVDDTGSLIMRWDNGSRLNVVYGVDVVRIIPNEPPKAKLIISEKAARGIFNLVGEYQTEVAWHGIVKRIEQNSYKMSDFRTYPQKVTGGSVVTDQQEYELWLNELSDEEFENLRLQGHSHVFMPAIPSSTDRELYDNIISQMKSDAFYIFMICNKKNEIWIEIHDNQAGETFSTDEVEIIIEEENQYGHIEGL